MTLSHILDTLDRIAGHETRLRTGLPELNRRARISSRRDGYPNRASGAQPGTHTTPREVYSIWTDPFETGLTKMWVGKCSCGYQTMISHGSTLEALSDIQVHYVDQHGSQAVSYSDTCGEAAIADNRPDPVALAYRRLERIIERIERDSRSAVALLNQTLEPDTTTNATGNDPWCEICARVKHPDGKPYLEPVYSKAKARTDVGGRLTDPKYLCRFDYEHVLSEGKLASLEFTRERLVRGRAPRKTA